MLRSGRSASRRLFISGSAAKTQQKIAPNSRSEVCQWACASSVQAAGKALWHAYGARSLASGADSSDDEHGHGVVQGRLGVPELLRDLATFGFPACPRIGLVKKPGPALLSSLVSFARSVFC